MEIDKLTQLKAEDLPKFLDHYKNFDKLDRDGLLRLVKAWPNPPGETEAEDLPEQLEFHFDLLGETDENKVAEIVSKKEFDVVCAVSMADNAATLCKYSASWMAEHENEFDADDVPAMEKMAADLEQSVNRIRGLISSKKKQQLKIGE